MGDTADADEQSAAPGGTVDAGDGTVEAVPAEPVGVSQDGSAAGADAEGEATAVAAAAEGGGEDKPKSKVEGLEGKKWRAGGGSGKCLDPLHVGGGCCRITSL